MDNKKEIIRRLNMMGYNVYDFPDDSELRITLRTNKGYTASQIVSYEQLSLELIVEEIIHSFNNMIKRAF